MLKIFFSVISILTVQAIFAQDFDMDKKSGLVKIDGKDAFYLIKANKTMLSYDLSLQNLDKEELIYFAMHPVDELPYNLKAGHTAGSYLFATFPKTANTAYVFFTSFAGAKNIAKQIANANLIIDQQIDPKAERAFVVSHNGTLIKEPETIQVNVNTNPPATSKPINITLKGNNIYNNDELVGAFKQSVKDSITTINVYNTSDTKIATATHDEADINSDWNVNAPDKKTYQFLYNPSTPLEKLFKALVDKGLF